MHWPELSADLHWACSDTSGFKVSGVFLLQQGEMLICIPFFCRSRTLLPTLCLLSRWDQALLIQAVPKSMEQRIDSIWSMPHPQPGISWAVYTPLALFQILPFIIIPVWTVVAAILFYQNDFLPGNWSKTSKWKAENFHHWKDGEIFLKSQWISRKHLAREKDAKGCVCPGWGGTMYSMSQSYNTSRFITITWKIGTKITSSWPHTLLWESHFWRWNYLG